MPTYVDPNACNACQSQHEGPLCVYICPNDLMVLDENSNKGFNQEPEMCSECYACVKLCPQEALHVRGYADFVHCRTSRPWLWAFFATSIIASDTSSPFPAHE